MRAGLMETLMDQKFNCNINIKNKIVKSLPSKHRTSQKLCLIIFRPLTTKTVPVDKTKNEFIFGRESGNFVTRKVYHRRANHSDENLITQSNITRHLHRFIIIMFTVAFKTEETECARKTQRPAEVHPEPKIYASPYTMLLHRVKSQHFCVNETISQPMADGPVFGAINEIKFVR